MEIIDLIICDDIRHEMGNKKSLIGVYDNLTIPVQAGKEIKWPRPMRLGLFLRLKCAEEGLSADTFQIEFIYKNKAFTHMKGPIKFPEHATFIGLVIQNEGFPIPGEGEIKFKLKFFENNNVIKELDAAYELKVQVFEQKQPEMH